MEFGVVFPIYSLPPKMVGESIKLAEDLGFKYALFWDHYLLQTRNDTYDAWMLISYLSPLTKKIKLGTCVTPLPFRHPAVLAKMVSTADHLSQGRVILGVGAGWLASEFEAYSEWDVEKIRVDKTSEALKIISRMWSEEKVEHQGKYYAVKGGILEPKPVQKPHPPLWFGTKRRRMLRLAAKYGSGLIPTMSSPEEYGSTVQMLKSEMKKIARRAKFTYAYAQTPGMNASATTKLVEEFGQVGCEVFCTTLTMDSKQFPRYLKSIASNVIPSFS